MGEGPDGQIPEAEGTRPDQSEGCGGWAVGQTLARYCTVLHRTSSLSISQSVGLNEQDKVKDSKQATMAKMTLGALQHYLLQVVQVV